MLYLATQSMRYQGKGVIDEQLLNSCVVRRRLQVHVIGGAAGRGEIQGMRYCRVAVRGITWKELRALFSSLEHRKREVKVEPALTGMGNCTTSAFATYGSGRFSVFTVLAPRRPSRMGNCTSSALATYGSGRSSVLTVLAPRRLSTSRVTTTP